MSTSVLSLSKNEAANTSNNDGASNSASKATTKSILMIRHGRSLGNDMMDQPGNRWGDPTFTDNGSLIDSPLSDVGIQQAKALSDDDDGIANIDQIELVVVSPLTRTLQTMQYAVLPQLPGHVPIIAQPLSTERVYTASDTGRPVAELLADFENVDKMANVNFDLLLPSSSNEKSEPWWYHVDQESAVPVEWRPNDAQQWYAVPGEPKDAFERRMVEFQEWLAARPEQRICLVGHWAVLRHLTDGYDFRNCEAKWVELNVAVAAASTVSNL